MPRAPRAPAVVLFDGGRRRATLPPGKRMNLYAIRDALHALEIDAAAPTPA